MPPMPVRPTPELLVRMPACSPRLMWRLPDGTPLQLRARTLRPRKPTVHRPPSEPVPTQNPAPFPLGGYKRALGRSAHRSLIGLTWQTSADPAWARAVPRLRQSLDEGSSWRVHHALRLAGIQGS